MPIARLLSHLITASLHTWSLGQSFELNGDSEGHL